MALTAANARVAVTGSVSIDITAAGAAPTSSSSALNAAYKDMGYISEDGVTLSMPDSGEATNLKAWQNGATVRTVRTTSDDNPQISFTIVETSLEVIKAVFGAAVTSSVADGTFDFDASDIRAHVRAALDVVDGAELIRIYAPYAIVSSIEEVNLTSTDLIGWGVTLDLERDSTLGCNFRSWMTALKTP